jgi:hypothetical protein
MRTRDEIEADELAWETVLEVLLDIRDLLAPVKRIAPDGRRRLGRKSAIVLQFVTDYPDSTAAHIHSKIGDGRSIESTHNALRRLIAQGYVFRDGHCGPATFRTANQDAEASQDADS